MAHSGPSDQHLAEAANRIVRGMIYGAQADPQSFAGDILLLARDTSGRLYLDRALGAYGDEDLVMMAKALMHRVAAERRCEADLLLHRVRTWSIFCVAAGSAMAAALLTVTGLDTTGRLLLLAGITVMIAGLGLAATRLATLRRKALRAEAAAVQALVSPVSSESGGSG